jgi:hypothetical protein
MFVFGRFSVCSALQAEYHYHHPARVSPTLGRGFWELFGSRDGRTTVREPKGSSGTQPNDVNMARYAADLTQVIWTLSE